jgi:hypothetical protein
MRTLDARARVELELPTGVFYDGSSYVDWDGARSKWHPGIGALVDELCARKNAHAHAQNAKSEAAQDAALAAVRIWCSQS